MIIRKILLFIFAMILSSSSFASKEHGGGLYHALYLEGGFGAKVPADPFFDWEADAWLGGDKNKLWLKSEGEYKHSEIEQAEIWLMYSRNIHTFWDLQVGARADVQDSPFSYVTFGVHGLAPYFFETGFHIFVSQSFGLGFRLEAEYEILFTQKFITEPYFEVDVSLKDMREFDFNEVLSRLEVGLQPRYEFTKSFAVYLDFKYELQLEGASFLEDEAHAFIYTAGLKLLL